MEYSKSESAKHYQTSLESLDYTYYIVTKPGDENSVYIGMTIQYRGRCRTHLANIKKFKAGVLDAQLRLYAWLDETCEFNILSVKSFATRHEASIIEYAYINEYIERGFNVLNTQTGKVSINPKEWKRQYNANPLLKEGRNTYQKTSPVAKAYRSDYYKLYYKAKARGLTVKEYKQLINKCL